MTRDPDTNPMYCNQCGHPAYEGKTRVESYSRKTGLPEQTYTPTWCTNPFCSSYRWFCLIFVAGAVSFFASIIALAMLV